MKPTNLSAVLVTLGLASCAPTTQKTTHEIVVTTPPPAQTTAPVTVTTTTSTVTTTPAQPTFRAVPALATRVTTFAKASQVIDPARTYRAVLNTSKGPITLELNAKAAPVAVNNFVFLALNHFYDGTRFHRVIDGFMAQGGDPQSTDLSQRPAWGTGGPGYSFSAENSNGLGFGRAGVLGMARSSSLDSQGSQFFITLAPADFLSGQYTVFGKVVDGLSTLNSLTKTAQSTAYGEQPIPGAQADVLSSVDILVSN
ncbi:peptidylprolyl isomerase [Deinococcus sp.]|uniref:peptidylprolyl isomerase n=1 Tax=Deinococcus sp. TaxID=47478 RepID=UPI0025BC7CF4|nr:peptidylprolyl isomerase [Deinococcus sp.]